MRNNAVSLLKKMEVGRAFQMEWTVCKTEEKENIGRLCVIPNCLVWRRERRMSSRS